MSPSTWVSIAALAWAFISTLVAWGFATGKFSGSLATLEERLRREIAEASRQAKHDALDELAPVIGRCVPKELHDEQIAELKRRVGNCERMLSPFGGRGVVGS